MPRSKQEANRAKQPALASHYRAIGPAAIVAALLHTAKKKEAGAEDRITPRCLKQCAAGAKGAGHEALTYASK